MTHVNHSDAEFLHDLLRLLRAGLRAGELVERRSDDPWTCAVALESAAASRHEISDVATCLDEWEMTGLVAPRQGPRLDSDCDPDIDPSLDHEQLEDLGDGSFDDRYTQGLLAHHHAVVDRSRREMIEGLSTRSRTIASHAIAEHSAAIAAVERRTAELADVS